MSMPSDRMAVEFVWVPLPEYAPIAPVNETRDGSYAAFV